MFTYERIKSLNDLEILIYNYVVANLDEAVKLPIRELADRIHVSPTTILRFCSKMGCEGYTEFKYRFREHMKEAAHKDLTDDYTVVQDFFKKVGSREFEKSIQQAAEIIHEKKTVIFVGMGTSGTLGRYGARYLMNLGKRALCIDDPFYPTDCGSYEDTAVVALSVSGEQRFLHRQIDGFKKGKAYIISITNTSRCTLAEISDMNISYYMPMMVLPGLYNVTSQVPVIYILEVLAQRIHKLEIGTGGA